MMLTSPIETQPSLDDSETMNDGSVVGLPNSSSDEEDSTTAGGTMSKSSPICQPIGGEEKKEGEALGPSPVGAAAETQLVEVAGETCSDDDHNEGGEKNGNDKEDELRSEVAAKDSTPVPTTLNPGGEGTLNADDQSTRLSLEERVQELETKLATLSRILQQQQRLSSRSLLPRSPTNSQRNLLQSQSHSQRSLLSPRLPEMPLMEDIQMDGEIVPGSTLNSSSSMTMREITDSPPLSQTHTTQKGMVPYLESPAPMDESPPRKRSLHQRKRLSFHLLYDGNEDNLALADDDNSNNTGSKLIMTPPPPTMDKTSVEITNNMLDGSPETANNTAAEQPVSAPLSSESYETPSQGDDNQNANGVTEGHESDVASQATQELRNGASPAAAAVAARVVSSGSTSDVSRMSSSSKKSNNNNNNAMESSPSNRSSLSENGGSQHNKTKKKQQEGGSGGTPTSFSSSTTEESSSSPSSARASSRIKAAILPPLLLSKDTRSKWLDHLNSFQESNHDVDRQMQEFIKVPGALERLLTSGLLICVDSFLYVWTVLPIRFAWSSVLLSLHYFFKWTKKPAGNYQFHRRHMYQLIQVSILFLIYRYILLPISIGKLYHWIRGQAMIKLYVLIAIVEVFDRLMCSMGQDCLDSLYWNTTRRPRSTRMLISVAVVMVYTAVHSLILFVHVATLNVAMNSADEALLALLIGGNFAEIKSTVFKKYNKASLFKIVASDICERFKLALFLGLILLLNFCQGMDSRKVSDYQRIAGIVWMSELLCDWLKHSFITKFNFIPSNVYPEYGLLLAGDVTGIGHEGVNLDHSHAVVKRIGFAQMPLVCVMARLVREAAKYMSLRIESKEVPLFVVILATAGCWSFLLVLKILLGSYLQRTSLAKLHAAPELSQTPLKSKQK